MNGATSSNTKVLRLRINDKHAKFLSGLARDVNFVWNYCNDLQITMFNRERRFLSGFDFAKFTRGATKEGLHLHSQTVNAAKDILAAGRRRLAEGIPAL
jgi:putative transposase